MNNIQNYGMLGNSVNFKQNTVRPLNIAYKNIKQNCTSGGIKNQSDLVEQYIPIKNTPFSFIKMITKQEQKELNLSNILKQLERDGISSKLENIIENLEKGNIHPQQAIKEFEDLMKPFLQELCSK